MSRLQAIENALSSINQAAFQELCDSFLALRNSNYSAFVRNGSQSGKQKTVKGTPDTFLRLPNGKYIFVEYSTNVTAGVSKLEDDVKKCIDSTKTGIPVSEISEIIICINFNLSATEIQTLSNYLANTYIQLTIHMLDSLAIELHFNHRDLAHEYLGLPLDTGQIVSIDKFIQEYNRASNGIATPLDNVFLHRERELKDLKEIILKNDFVILTGAPGIGKTKLALEGIRSFLSENLNYGAYCVSYKNHTLLDDLYQYFDSEKDYILFVDDANRIDAFSQITGFYRATRKGKLKVLITVRDYAFQEVGMLCQEFSPVRRDLEKFTDEQIIDIIKAKPFEILNQIYYKDIVRIADGNPRLAIMTALLAKAEQSIQALHDVSDLFESYYSTFIKDDGEFSKPLNIQCLGLIAFFFTIPYKDREITNQILGNFGIEYPAFIDAIDKLEKLELVEIQFEHVKIPEQNLSTYFFYKAFIKDNLLPFDILLEKYFDSNADRFRDCVIPANNTFGGERVMNKLQPFLRTYWKSIKEQQEKAFKFLSTFWFYLIDETLEFIYKYIQSLPSASTENYTVAYENNAFARDKNDLIELLGEFFRYPVHLKDVLTLAFEYARKKPEDLAELIHKIRERMTFDYDDAKIRFVRQLVLFQILIEGVNKRDKLLSTSFYELAQTFLSFKFQHTGGGRNHSISWHYYTVPNIPPIQDFRKRIWETVDANFEYYPSNSFNLLQSYATVHPDVSKELMDYDVPFLLNIIDKHLTPASFEHCKYVQDQLRWCKRNSVSHPLFPSLAAKFTNSTYESYLKLDWNRLRDKEMYDFDDYDEYQKLKEAEIRTSFIFKSPAEVKEFYDLFHFVKKTSETDGGYPDTLEFIIDENCNKDFDVGCQLLLLIIERNNEFNYVPRLVFRNHLNTREKADKIWNIIQSAGTSQHNPNGMLNKGKAFWNILVSERFNVLKSWTRLKCLKQKTFNHKEAWELSFYDYVDESLLNKEYVQALLRTMNCLQYAYTIHFDRLQRLLKIKPNLFQEILKIIVERNAKEGKRITVWVDIFTQHFGQLGNDLQLIKQAYLQQDKINSHFDHRGDGFLNILRKDANFLYEYVGDLYSEKKFGHSASRKNLSFIWEIENIELQLQRVFDVVTEKEPYFGISDHFCNCFFKHLQGDKKESAKKFLLEYCKENHTDTRKMNVIVDVVRNSMNELFEELLLLFLSQNQDVNVFSRIWWRGNGTSGSGNVILSDIEAADWRNILSIVEKSSVGISLLPIKQHLNAKIEACLQSGDRERLLRFINKDW